MKISATGIRLETANNPRSPWDTFGNNTTAGSVTPSDKNSSGLYLGRAQRTIIQRPGMK